MKKLYLTTLIVLLGLHCFGQYKTTNVFKMMLGSYILNEVKDINTGESTYVLSMKSMHYTHITTYFICISASSLDEVKDTLNKWSEMISTYEEGISTCTDDLILTTIKTYGIKGLQVSRKTRDDMSSQVGIKQIKKMIIKINKF